MTRADKQLLTLGITGSLAGHFLLLVAGVCYVTFAALPRIPVKVTKREPEVTLLFPKDIEIVPAQPPPVPVVKPKAKKLPYIRTTQNEPEAAPPGAVNFQSDRNTTAAATQAPDPDGDKRMPSLKGSDLPTMDLANRDFVKGQLKEDSAVVPPPSKEQQDRDKKQAQQPPQTAKQDSPDKKDQPSKPQMRVPDPEMEVQPKVAKKEDTPGEKLLNEAASQQPGDQKPMVAQHKETPKSESPPELKPPTEELPVPRAIPVPPIRNAPKPEKDAFQPDTRVPTLKGTISQRGPQNAVDTAATPMGRYERKVYDAIGSRWRMQMAEKADFAEPSIIRVQFYVNKAGKPENIRFVFNEANAVLTDVTLSAILKASIPPIPRDLLPLLDQDRFLGEIDFIIH